MIFLDQYFHRRSVTSEQMDFLWEEGWRHFGVEFFRYSVAYHRGSLFSVMPLRIALDRFQPSSSQKRVLARNRDARVIIRDTFIDKAKDELFYRHRERFTDNIPGSLYGFLSSHPAEVPCRNREICVYLGDKLIAVSFLDIGSTATSGLYAMFDPPESKRSLGIFTILEAIRYSRELDCRYYYPGYAYREPSVYDYKKNFSGLEYLDWQAGWKPYSEAMLTEEPAVD